MNGRRLIDMNPGEVKGPNWWRTPYDDEPVHDPAENDPSIPMAPGYDPVTGKYIPPEPT